MAGATHVQNIARRIFCQYVAALSLDDARALVSAIVAEIAGRQKVDVEIIDLIDILPDLARTTDPRLAEPAVARVIEAIETADGLCHRHGRPQRAPIPGLFKHLFDLIDPKAPTARPVILSATGGSERHALVIEHSLHPLFSFFNAAIMPTGIYATERDFIEGQPSHTGVIERIRRAADEFVRFNASPKSGLVLARSA